MEQTNSTIVVLLPYLGSMPNQEVLDHRGGAGHRSGNTPDFFCCTIEGTQDIVLKLKNEIIG